MDATAANQLGPQHRPATAVAGTRLQEELRIRHGSGAFGKSLLQLAKTDVLVLDDWGMGAIITSQLPIEHSHAWIGDATVADAILS